MTDSRREFLASAGASALLAGLPAGWAGGAYASDAPESPKVRIGIIALTDCSSIVMAHELGLFKKYGIESTVSKEASWGGDSRSVVAGRKPGDPHAAASPTRRRWDSRDPRSSP